MTEMANQIPYGTHEPDDVLQVLGVATRVLGVKIRCYKADNYEEIERKRGVYIFVDASGRALYIGEAPKQYLKTRIGQNYSGGTGATFRKNWALRNGGRKDPRKGSLATERERLEIIRDNIDKFKEAARNWTIITLYIPKNSARDQAKRERRWIHVLEKTLIALIDPKYNRD